METSNFDLSRIFQELPKGTKISINPQKESTHAEKPPYPRAETESFKHALERDPRLHALTDDDHVMADMLKKIATKSLPGFLTLKRIIAKQQDITAIQKARESSQALDTLMKANQLEFGSITAAIDITKKIPFLCCTEVLIAKRDAIATLLVSPTHYCTWPIEQKIDFLDTRFIPLIREICSEYVKKQRR